MTMHLVGPYLTTTNYKKRHTKMTKAKQEEMNLRWREYNKWAKRNNLSAMTFDEYTDYCHGKVRETKKINTKENYRPADMMLHRSADHRKLYPSLNSGVGGVAAKPAPKVYTGTLIKGIATMHKSNAVPVFNSEQAEEIARMRR